MRWRTALLALILGLLATLAVPRVMRWMSREGWLAPAEIGYASHKGGDVNRYRELDCTHYYWTSRLMKVWSEMPSAVELLTKSQDGYLYFMDLPDLRREDSGLSPGIVLRAELQIITQGFPFRCTWGWSRDLTPVIPGTATPLADEGGILRIPWNGRTFMLSCLPLWPGLIANTVLYGAAWYGLFAYARFARRRTRTRRGQCVECGYSREGLEAGVACPECGAASSAADSVTVTGPKGRT